MRQNQDKVQKPTIFHINGHCDLVNNCKCIFQSFGICWGTSKFRCKYDSPQNDRSENENMNASSLVPRQITVGWKLLSINSSATWSISPAAAQISHHKLKYISQVQYHGISKENEINHKIVSNIKEKRKEKEENIGANEWISLRYFEVDREPHSRSYWLLSTYITCKPGSFDLLLALQQVQLEGNQIAVKKMSILPLLQPVVLCTLSNLTRCFQDSSWQWANIDWLYSTFSTNCTIEIAHITASNSKTHTRIMNQNLI